MARSVSVQKSRFNNVKRHSFLSATALTAVGLAMTATPAFADNWTDHTAIVGDISIDTSLPNTTNITQHTNFTKVQGNGDINAGWTVNVAQPSTSSKYVLYDTKDDPTMILGNLNANGEIYIFDQNGVIFGQNSRVDVGSLVATTGHIADSDLLDNDGRLTIENAVSGEISLQGSISVADAGLAAFVAPTVSNSGVINAKMGKVVLASGEKVTLDLYGDSLVEVALNDKLSKTLINNSGTINAEGGTVVLQAGAAKGIVDSAINMSGVINASSASVKGGKIVLGGGTVKVSGKMNASGKTGGGKIDVKGTNVQVADTALLQSDAYFTGNGGDIDVIAQEHADFRGTILSRGGVNGGNGGNAEVSGYKVLGYQGYADLSAANGTMGTLLLDPEFAVIHSGLIHNPLGLGVVVSAQALANSMRNSNVVVWADNYVDVGTKAGGYNISTGNAFLDAIVNAGLNALPDGDIDLSTFNVWENQLVGYFFGFPIYLPVNVVGTTNGGLTLEANTINFNRDLTMGNGSVTVDADTVNLDSKIFASNGTTLLGDDRLSSNAGTVNVLSNDASIQQGVYLADDAGGAEVNLAATTFTQGNIDINKSMTISGAGRNNTTLDATGFTNGFQITQDLGNKNVTIRRMAIENANQDGVLVADTANLKTISLNQVALRNNAYHGFALYGDSAQAVNILNSVFLDNGFGGGSRGEGDIAAYLYNGDVTIRNVDIQNNSAAGLADYGIQIRGSDTFAESGEIILDNVSVAGSYRAAPLGIQRFTALDLTMQDVTLGGQTDAGTGTTGWGAFYVSNIGTNPIDLANTAFLDTAGAYIENDSEADIDATGVDFNGVTGATATLDQHFDIEDKVNHAIDNSARGLVTWNPGNLYVTQNSGSIQRGIDNSDIGGNVYVSDGSFTEQLFIDKNLNLIGDGAHNTTILNAPTVMVESYTQDNWKNYAIVYVHDAANVNISGFQINGDMNTGNSYNDTTRFIGVAYQNAGGNFTNNWVRNIATVGNSDRSGFALLASAKNKKSVLNISGNEFTDFQTYGIALADQKLTATVKNNVITGDKNNIDAEQTGIYVTSQAKVTIGGDTDPTDGNDISKVDNGIEILKTSYTMVQNNMMNAVDYGIKVVNGRFNQLLGNTINGNSITGVSLNNADGTIVSGGTINRFTNGIVVENSDDVLIDGVTLKNITDTHIDIADSDNATVQKNTMNGGKTGVRLTNVTDSMIGGADDSFGNTIRNIEAGYNNAGISISGGSGLTISHNLLRNNGGQSIYALGSWGMPETDLTISDNIIRDAQHNGVYVKHWNGATISGNTINGTTSGHGIQLELSDNTDILNNRIVDAANAGINLRYGNNGTTIQGNRIIDAKDGIVLATEGGQSNFQTLIGSLDGDAAKANRISGGETGILVNGGGNLWIQNNNISDASKAGIDVSNSGGAYNFINVNTINSVKDGIVAKDTTVLIADNKIGFNGALTGNGISVQDGDDSQVLSNRIKNVGKIGINIVRGNRVTVNDNELTAIGNQGVRTEQVAGLTANRNVLKNISWSGFQIEGGSNVSLNRNTLEDVRGNGIQISGTNGVVVENSDVRDIRLSGIVVNGARDVTVDANTVRRTGEDGIRIGNAKGSVSASDNIVRRAGEDGIQVGGNGVATIERNIVRTVAADGIKVSGFADANIDRNRVRNAGQDGIEVAGNNSATLNRNRVVNSGVNGIHASGVANGDVVLTRNRLIDNVVGARFESGTIDLTGQPNVFSGGTNGLVFDPGVAPAGTLSLLNDTIGTTEFNGQTGFYVELLNDALFNPGTPTVIDGRFARYDGVSASDNPGFLLSQAEFDAINDKLWHFPNDNTLGLFNFGFAPVLFSIDQEDLLQYFAPVQLQQASLNLTINGLPRVTAGALDLNNISPFAGGNTDPSSLNNISTQAGGEEPSASELNQVATQAGGTEASCWGDAAQIAQGGQVVNVSYGSSPEDVLNGAASCGSSL